MALPIATAHFHSKIKELPRMLLWIRKHLIDAGLDASSIRKFELASEEAIVNVIRHAYQGGAGKIEILFRLKETEVHVMIVDHGPPFNPLEGKHRPALASSLEERKEGGLGILMIRKCVDDVHYRREDDWNVLTLIKRFSRKT
jgi:anti-sigma regulatory factor (Ser/Thr protein kinase)